MRLLKTLILCALSVYGCLGVDQEQSCDAKCSPSYPLHTYPKPAYNVACARGCRLAFVDYYTTNGQTKSCNETCGEAYTNDLGAVYACTVGCTVDVNTVIGDDGMTEVTMISNMMDLMLLSRLMDMLSVSSSSSVNDDSNSEWSDEVDVYVPEGWESANSSTDGTTGGWSVYSMVWFMDSTPSEVTSSTADDVTDMSDNSNGYYLVYYKHWSLTKFGFLSQLLCYITLFLFMVALLKCCHVLLSEGDNEDDNSKLSVSADYDTDEDDDYDETAELLRRKKEKSFVSDLHSQVVRMPAHIGRPAISMSSFLPVQDTRISGGKVEGILTVV